MHMTLKQGRNISYKNNSLFNCQGLDLHLKNFENDFAKNRICIVDYVRYWKRLPDNILKLKELFLLRSFHMVQVLYQIIPLSLLQASVFDDYSNLFLIQEYLQYLV